VSERFELFDEPLGLAFGVAALEVVAAELYRTPTPNPEAERKQRERTTKRLIAQLEKLGNVVTVQTATAEAAVSP